MRGIMLLHALGSQYFFLRQTFQIFNKPEGLADTYTFWTLRQDVLS